MDLLRDFIISEEPIPPPTSDCCKSKAIVQSNTRSNKLKSEELWSHFGSLLPDVLARNKSFRCEDIRKWFVNAMFGSISSRDSTSRLDLGTKELAKRRDFVFRIKNRINGKRFCCWVDSPWSSDLGSFCCVEWLSWECCKNYNSLLYETCKCPQRSLQQHSLPLGRKNWTLTLAY